MTTLRRAVPWAIGLAILVVLAVRLPWAQFRRSLENGPHLALAAITLAVTAGYLATDAVATWISLLALRIRRPLRDVTVARGSTYLLFLVNYAVGQGGFGYYLYRTGESQVRAVGATLFLVGTNLAALLVLSAACWFVVPPGLDRAVWWVVVIGVAGFVLYLGVIAGQVRWLSRRAALEPLFDAGVAGHLVALAARLPHVAGMVLAHWVTLHVWGLAVPFTTAASIMLVIAIVSALPISPAGIGTTQATLVYFYAPYAHGLTAGARAADVLAYSVVQMVYGVVASTLVGVVCLPLLRRLLPRAGRDTNPP